MLAAAEVQQHNSRSSCWVVISGSAYDLTDFLDSHPGGASSILRCAGKDATEEYEPIHPPGTIEKSLNKSKHLGPAEQVAKSSSSAPKDGESAAQQAPLSTLQNLDDFRQEALKILPRKSWIYYDSAADSLASVSNNRRDWTRVHLRPRILRNVARVSTSCRVMGHDSSWPFFIAPAALAKLGHEDGELCLARGAARHNIPYCSSTYSSVAHADLSKCLAEEQKGGALLFQLYVPIRKEGARELIQRARQLGFKALVVTVDSAVIGKREEDDRYKAWLDHEAGYETPRTISSVGEQPVLRGAHSSTLEWDDLPWIRQEWGDAGPIVLKGIQTVEDVELAAQAGVDAIYLSNHGGRQMDYAPSALRVLLEIRKFSPDLLQRLEIYLDGGVTRGTDVLKALALGAKGVGLGRPFMYSLCGYGTEGVCQAIQILGDEVETTMRLLGVTDLSQLTAYYVNASALELELPRSADLRDPHVTVSKL